MKLYTLVAPILAAALAAGCASTQLRYDNNGVNRERFAQSSPQQAVGIVASIQTDGTRSF